MEYLGERQNCTQIPTVPTDPRLYWKGHRGKQDIGPEDVFVKDYWQLILRRLQDDRLGQGWGLLAGEESTWSK